MKKLFIYILPLCLLFLFPSSASADSDFNATNVTIDYNTNIINFDTDVDFSNLNQPTLTIRGNDPYGFVWGNANSFSCTSTHCSVVMQPRNEYDAGVTEASIEISGGRSSNYISQAISYPFDNPTNSDVPPDIQPISRTLITINQRNIYSQDGFFTDPDSTSWTGTVDYGDYSDPGTQPLITNSDKTFSLNHTYNYPGIYNVTVSVTDSQGETDTKIVATVKVIQAVTSFNATNVTFDPNTNIVSFDTDVDFSTLYQPIFEITNNNGFVWGSASSFSCTSTHCSGVMQQNYSNHDATDVTNVFIDVASTPNRWYDYPSQSIAFPLISNSTPVVAINAGGATQGNYAPDADYSGGTTYSTTDSVDTTGVDKPAPEAVYQSVRYGNFTYTIPNLTANGTYTVRLHFNELYWNAAGQRTFNTSIHGTQVLSNFDIYQTAGGKDKAIVEQFPATADATGNITIQFTSVTDNAMVNGIELYTGTLPQPSPTPTPTPVTSASINAGGATVENYLADNGYTGGTTYSTTASIDTTGVTNSASQSVYQTVRYGNFSYTIPTYSPNTNYTVRLDFSEPYWNAAGQRLFNVVINGIQDLSNFDVYQAAGGENKAVSEQFTTTTDSNGLIHIQFNTVVDNAMVSGIAVSQQ